MTPREHIEAARAQIRESSLGLELAIAACDRGGDPRSGIRLVADCLRRADRHLTEGWNTLSPQLAVGLSASQRSAGPANDALPSSASESPSELRNH